MATFATAVSIAVQYVMLKRWTAGNIDTRAEESREDRAEITGIIKSQVPNSIFLLPAGTSHSLADRYLRQHSIDR